MRQVLESERVIYVGTLHPIVLAWPIARALVALVVLSVLFALDIHPVVEKMSVLALWGVAAVSAMSVAYNFLDRRATRWTITDDRLIVEWGVVARNFDEIPLDKILNVRFSESVIGRMLNYGALSVQIASGSWIGLSPLDYPAEFARQLNIARGGR